MFAALEAKVEALIADLDKEGRAEWARLVADAKAEEAKLKADVAQVGPRVEAFAAELKQLAEGVIPGVKAGIVTAVETLVTDVEQIIGQAIAGNAAANGM